MLKRESINELITKQNYENIAKQSFSFQGINANIKEYNSLLKSSVKESNAFAEVVASHNMKLGNYLTSLNGANAGLGGYIKSLGIAKLKTIALSIATTALNMVIGAIASAIASFIIKGVTNIINSAENMKKAVDDMVTSYNDSLKTLESHKKTINDIKDDYATLSKGVDELGNNVSLTTDEYKKYQDICNQIADIYPSLIAGHTSEGNAILTLKGNVEALTKAYKDEQKAAAASVISGSDKENTNVVKNYKNESKTGIKNAFKSAFTFNSDKSMVNGLSNDLLQKEADIIDTKGWFASTLLNNSFIEQEQKNLDKLKEERTALVNALNSAIDSGKIEEYSEDWYDMQSSIDDCTSSILDAEKALIEYDNAIRQINWDAFDRTRDDVEYLINETDFLVELLKDVGITDDNGNMTKEGQAAQALLAQKYQLYLNQAKAYKDEISKINEDLANDPYDKELLDRKQDLIDKEQEAIKSAMSEKDAIKDLTNDAYTDFIDKLGDAIDKYKELMDTMKDAYDYEKSIREKTEALNALEKQYSAYQGDNSEEGKKNIQQLKDQINTAKDNLKDTEYEKLISDTEKILDDLKDDVQSWVDQRLDQLDDLIQDIIEQSNENASDISQTINSTAENYGYNLSKPLLFSAKNVNYGKFN